MWIIADIANGHKANEWELRTDGLALGEEPPSTKYWPKEKDRMEIEEYEHWTQVQIYYAKSYDPLP